MKTKYIWAALIFGAAYLIWRKRKSLSLSGAAAPQIASAGTGSGAAAPTSSGAAATAPTGLDKQKSLKKGSSGGEVEALQIMMNEDWTEGAAIATDGQFGPATEERLKKIATKVLESVDYGVLAVSSAEILALQNAKDNGEISLYNYEKAVRE